MPERHSLLTEVAPATYRLPFSPPMTWQWTHASAGSIVPSRAYAGRMAELVVGAAIVVQKIVPATSGTNICSNNTRTRQTSNHR